MSDLGSFWARRRAAVQAEAEADAHKAEEAEAAVHAEALAEKEDDEILAEMGLPNPNQMQQGDNFAAFMARDVPEHLRRQALRTLWRSNPVLACVDGLNEYDDDYRAAMLLQEPVKTAYRVGKGMLKHIEEMERKAQAEDALAAEDIPQADAPDDAAEAETLAAAEAPTPVIEEDLAVLETGASTEPMAEAPAPRRMRFHFEEATG